MIYNKKSVLMLISLIGIGIIPPIFLKGSLLYFLSGLLTMAILGISWDMIYGYTGSLSLAHAAFFGIGNYVVLYSLRFFGSILIALPAALIVCFLVAFPLGRVAIKGGEHGFIIITLIIGVIFHKLAVNFVGITGGSDGINVTLPQLNLYFAKFSFYNLKTLYIFIFLITVATYLLFRHLLNFTTFGVVLEGIRENDVKMKSIGYNVKFFKALSFSISSAFAGLAGGLHLLRLSFTGANIFQITTSFKAVMYVLLGGAGTLYGGVIGAVVIQSLKHFLSQYFRFFMIFPAALVMVIILFYPDGIMGIIKRLRKGEA